MKTGQGRSVRRAVGAAGPWHLLLAVAALGLHMQRPAGAAAQIGAAGRDTPARAALLTTTRVKTGPTAERDAAFDAVVHTALDKLHVVEVVARPALDLEAIQLSLDCVGETPPCLLSVAKHTNAELLIAPSVQRIGEELVLSILYFDARGATELRRVSRRQTGQTLKTETLDQVPHMLRELFQIEEQPAVTEPPAAVEPELAADDSYSDAYEPTQDDGAPVGPLLLGAGGLVTIGAGVAVFMVMKNTEDDYAAITVRDRERAKEADDKLEQGQTQALIASVLIGAGSAALAAGVVWLAVEVGDNEQTPGTALRPWLGPDNAGLMLTGTLGGGP